jgi:hypothetical protein
MNADQDPDPDPGSTLKKHTFLKEKLKVNF